MHKTKESKCIGTSQDTGRALPREIPGAKADPYKMQNWNFYSQIQKYKHKLEFIFTNVRIQMFTKWHESEITNTKQLMWKKHKLIEK